MEKMDGLKYFSLIKISGIQKNNKQAKSLLFKVWTVISKLMIGYIKDKHTHTHTEWSMS